MSIERRMKVLLGEVTEPLTVPQLTQKARHLMDSKWDARRSAMTSAGASLKPQDIERIFHEVTGLNLKATMKTARQLGRDFFRKWTERSEPGPIFDPQYVALMQPHSSANAKLKSPSDDLASASVLKFVAMAKAEGKISGAWKAGFTDTRKDRDEAENVRKLEIIHAAPPGVFHKHTKNAGYGLDAVEAALAAATDPKVREQLQRMLALMKAPIVY